MASAWLTVEELEAIRGADEIGRFSLVSRETAIEVAEARASPYLLNRYGENLPASPAATPMEMKVPVATLAHRALIPGSQVSEALLVAEREALKFLGDVARGVAALNLPGRPEVDQGFPGIVAIQPEGAPPPLNFTTLRGM